MSREISEQLGDAEGVDVLVKGGGDSQTGTKRNILPLKLLKSEPLSPADLYNERLSTAKSNKNNISALRLYQSVLVKLLLENDFDDDKNDPLKAEVLDVIGIVKEQMDLFESATFGAFKKTSSSTLRRVK